MRIKLSDHFTVGRLLRYTFPSMVMMVFTSIYSIVDGFFISNYVGKEPFAAVNLVYPVLIILGAIGFMLGAGGSAITAQTLGEGKKEKAQEYFTMLVWTTFILGLAATDIMEIVLKPLTGLLGATGALQDYSILYGRICMLSMPFFMLQTSYQTYFNVAEKPKLGLAVTVLAGCTNIVLDFLLVGVAGMGLAGAALATNISEIMGGLVPVIYFSRKNTSLLRFRKAPFVKKIFLKACGNGSSEMLSNIASSVVSILYNYILLDLAGADCGAANCDLHKQHFWGGKNDRIKRQVVNQHHIPAVNTALCYHFYESGIPLIAASMMSASMTSFLFCSPIVRASVMTLSISRGIPLL